MLISTRGRYALRFLVDLAEHQVQDHETFLTSKELSERQAVSRKYTERLLALLSSGGFVDAHHGKNGGYRLSKSPSEFRISDVLIAMGEKLAPVECLECDTNKCSRSEFCRTLPMWQKLDGMIHDFFDSRTLADLMK